ncbi:hypothetical protein [Roseomonas chloroacetimidivorans]|uniref:hypothetical protein n=1 Tax=Roseomonas chloroacetimidivorans TaxID=1766656 RepID=UPI003C780509
MPVRPEDRTTVNLGADLIREARARATEEGREFSELVARAVRAYLAAPLRVVGADLPGLVPPDPDAGLREDVQVLVAEVRKLIPQVAAAAEGHTEVLDTLDEITAELGRRRGAAEALEQVAAATKAPPPPSRGR